VTAFVQRYRNFLDATFASYRFSAESLSVFRILFALHALLFGAIPSITYLSTLPHSFFTPPLGVAQLFSGFPSVWLCVGLYILTTLAAMAMLVGWRTRWASIVFSVLNIAAYSLAFSLGKINHNTAYLFLPLVFAFTDWGERYSLDALRRGSASLSTQDPYRSSVAVFCYAFALGWMFFTAGIQKVIGGWLDPSSQATFGWFVNYYFAEQTHQFLAPLLIHVRLPAMWESADWATVGFELFFLLAVFRRNLFIIACCCAVFFHFLVLNTLNINSSGFLICYLAFVQWQGTFAHRWLSRASNILAKSWVWIPSAVVSMAVLVGLGVSSESVVTFPLAAIGVNSPSMLVAFVCELAAVLVVLRYALRLLFRF
jgi:uncharacterized membrane protein YphA (DoxX/SURF4 family)